MGELEKIESLGDDELFEKVQNLYTILSIIAPSLLKKFWKPSKLFKFAKFGLKIKANMQQLQSATTRDSQVRAAISALGVVLEFRRENKIEFDEIFDALDEIMATQENRNNLADSIVNVMK